VKKLSIEYINNEFNKCGYKLLTTNYINSRCKLDYICPNGHKHSISWNGWKKGDRCPYCSNLAKPTIEFIKECISNEGYTLISTEYVNAKTNIELICNNGHIFYITWSNWKNKTRPRRCPHCSKRPPIDIEFVKHNIESGGYKLISNQYINAKTKLELICSNNHTYNVSWDNWSTKNNRCPICNSNGVSVAEKLLFKTISSYYNNTLIIENDRSIITPYELDIVIPDKKIAIEYCGLYWHSELAGKDRNYHLNKLNLCNEKGYKLITVFEDEWLLKKDIVISRLKNILGIDDNITRLYARLCVVKEISTNEASTFCSKYHLQGYNGSSIKLGLFYDNELVSVMTFSKQSISKGSYHTNGVWELQRFCSKTNHIIIGGSSKLLKYFERTYQWKKIISYADRRWSDGNLYDKLNFKFEYYTKCNYWYFSEREYPRRRHRFTLRKSSSMVTGTEWQNRINEGWDRIWDCGNLKYVKYNLKGI